jgi:hypothetical protein
MRSSMGTSDELETESRAKFQPVTALRLKAIGNRNREIVRWV